MVCRARATSHLCTPAFKSFWRKSDDTFSNLLRMRLVNIAALHRRYSHSPCPLPGLTAQPRSEDQNANSLGTEWSREYSSPRKRWAGCPNAGVVLAPDPCFISFEAILKIFQGRRTSVNRPLVAPSPRDDDPFAFSTLLNIIHRHTKKEKGLAYY